MPNLRLATRNARGHASPKPPHLTRTRARTHTHRRVGMVLLELQGCSIWGSTWSHQWREGKLVDVVRESWQNAHLNFDASITFITTNSAFLTSRWKWDTGHLQETLWRKRTKQCASDWWIPCHGRFTQVYCVREQQEQLAGWPVFPLQHNHRAMIHLP